MKRILVVMWCSIGLVQAQWRVEGGATVSHFQQQVKRAVGDERGQRLVNEFQIGLSLLVTAKVHEHLRIGLFSRADRGERFLANFSGFDRDGRTMTQDGIGGTYTELWVGPAAQAFWRSLFVTLGFAPYGRRFDTARNDLPNSSGETDDAFALHPTIAWLIAVGGNLPLSESTSMTASIEYRPRYYSGRGGKSLQNDIEHGTQSIVPIFGIAFSL